MSIDKKYVYYDLKQEYDFYMSYAKDMYGGIYSTRYIRDFLVSDCGNIAYIIQMNRNKRIANIYEFGYVYIIKGTHNGSSRYKIGKANDLTKRLHTFNIKIPFDIYLKMSFLVRDPYRLENFLHREFKEKREAGEWFNLTDDDFKSIYLIGVTQEVQDLDYCYESLHIEYLRKKRNEDKKKWKNDKEYIEYLETILVMNSIEFDARGV